MPGVAELRSSSSPSGGMTFEEAVLGHPVGASLLMVFIGLVDPMERKKK